MLGINNLQFVPFRQYTNKPLSMLTKDTLAEVPKQLLAYMQARNIPPRPKPVYVPVAVAPPQPQ
jgi:hypothetical protein